MGKLDVTTVKSKSLLECVLPLVRAKRKKEKLNQLKKKFFLRGFFIFFSGRNRTFNRRDDEKVYFHSCGWISVDNLRKLKEIRHSCERKNEKNSSAGSHQRRWCRKIKIMQFDTQRRVKREKIKFKRFFFPFLSFQFDGKCNFGPNKDETQRKCEFSHFFQLSQIFLLFRFFFLSLEKRKKIKI